MLKVEVENVRMHVAARFRVQGSVLQDSIQAEGVSIETRLEIDSAESAEKVARLVRTAENGCFIMQCLLKSVPITATTLLNGAPLSVS